MSPDVWAKHNTVMGGGVSCFIVILLLQERMIFPFLNSDARILRAGRVIELGFLNTNSGAIKAAVRGFRGHVTSAAQLRMSTEDSACD